MNTPTTPQEAARLAMKHGIRLHWHEGFPEPTARQIAALIDEVRGLEREIWIKGAKLSIPTAAMEQEFQTHYRRGYEAGKAACLLGGE